MISKTNLFNVFGLEVNRGDISTIAGSILGNIEKNSRTLVVTPNSDHFVRWRADPRFQQLYDHAQYRLIDGAPLFWIARILGGSDVYRITGIDLTLYILDSLALKNIPLAIIGGSSFAMSQAISRINRDYPDVEIFLNSTPSKDELTSEKFVKNMIVELEKKEKKIVLICLGSPKQEEFYEFLNRLGSGSGIYLCVGGTIDFLAGLKFRAPRLIQKIGFEWLYRFAQEPVRLFERYFLKDYKIIKYFFIAARMRMALIFKRLAK